MLEELEEKDRRLSVKISHLSDEEIAGLIREDRDRR